MGLRTEQLGKATIAAAVPYVAVLAFPKQERPARRSVYRDLVVGVATTIILPGRKPKTRPEAGWAIGQRIDWMIRHADAAVVVWDGQDTTIGSAVRSPAPPRGDSVFATLKNPCRV